LEERMKMEKKVFCPNGLKLDEIDSLQDWQLLVGAFHFAPTRGDCVSIGYEYSYGFDFGEDFSDNRTYKGHTAIWCETHPNKTSLKGEVDLDDARKILTKEYTFTKTEDMIKDGWTYKKVIEERPSFGNWQDFAKHVIKEGLINWFGDENGDIKNE
jgi:hypothetical protein